MINSDTYFKFKTKININVMEIITADNGKSTHPSTHPLSVQRVNTLERHWGINTNKRIRKWTVDRVAALLKSKKQKSLYQR